MLCVCVLCYGQPCLLNLQRKIAATFKFPFNYRNTQTKIICVVIDLGNDSRNALSCCGVFLSVLFLFYFVIVAFVLRALAVINQKLLDGCFSLFSDDRSTSLRLPQPSTIDLVLIEKNKNIK